MSGKNAEQGGLNSRMAVEGSLGGDHRWTARTFSFSTSPGRELWWHRWEPRWHCRCGHRKRRHSAVRALAPDDRSRHVSGNLSRCFRLQPAVPCWAGQAPGPEMNLLKGRVPTLTLMPPPWSEEHGCDAWSGRNSRGPVTEINWKMFQGLNAVFKGVLSLCFVPVTPAIPLKLVSPGASKFTFQVTRMPPRSTSPRVALPRPPHAGVRVGLGGNALHLP